MRDSVEMISTRSRRLKARSASCVLLCWAIGLFLLSPLANVHGDESGDASKLQFFEAKIRPVLIEHCYECHAADSKIIRGGLRVDTASALTAGGDSGPAVVSGKPDESLLLKAIKHVDFEMPPEKKLPDEVIADFEKWVADGAIDPRKDDQPAKLKAVDFEEAKKHWAFQPISSSGPPIVAADQWSNSPIDSFIYERLQREQQEPSGPTDKRTLIRRAYFDLTGLPPTIEEVEDFVSDNSPAAFERAIDRLLASPKYGERWGRHWLDLVRYATTNGADENHGLPVAWRFRDWVVRKVNDDLPFDEFTIQQLAGDLLPAPADEFEAGELLTATGMLVLGPKMLAEQDKEKMMIDIVDEQIDTVSRTMLGLTVGCARCHDHKFDPISSKDYYSLAGIFYSTKTMADRAFVSKWMERPLPSQAIIARRAEHQAKIDTAKAELAQLKSPEQDEAIKQKKAQVEELEKAMPPFDMVMAADESETKELPIFLRGNHLKPAPDKVTRGVPLVLTSFQSAPAIPEKQSGRLELAKWFVDPANPLTSRVMVNRIWMWHFGKAIMRSPSNWGLKGELPTHPELLDWLAQEFIRKDWSLKAMHRVIMTSSSYQMSSSPRPGLVELDPENRWLWRQNRRRMEAEPVRDSILYLGRSLDTTIGGPEVGVDGKRRAIYLQIDRAALYAMFSTFDYVETANHIEQRPATTVPNQALFLMNSALVHEQSRQIAEGLGLDPAQPIEEMHATIDQLFELFFARKASSAEVERVHAFLKSTEASLASVGDPRERRIQSIATLCRTLFASNEFIFVE